MTGKKKGSECIKVVVRIRPLNSKEIQSGHEVTTVAHEDRGVIEVRNPSADASEPSKTFTFDAVFSDKATQRSIYDVCAAPVVQSVLEGYNGTVFAYGQTGAGKTHTMEGCADSPELRGIIPNAIQHIFDHVSLETANEKYLVRASYFEIYNEEIRDLLSEDSKASLELRETTDSGVYVKNLKSFVVKSASEIDNLMQIGKKNRTVGSTLMNQASSRSHSVFTVVVECCSSDDRGEHIRVGKLNLVDLAGSERQSKTGATGERLKEATKINLSLSALGNVISALVDGNSNHIPYRDSKLTRILQDSLGGNTKTVMCANAGPAQYNYDETISTLRYANRAKKIKNKPKINEDPKDAMMREYQIEITKLKAQLSHLNSDANITFGGSEEKQEWGSKRISDAELIDIRNKAEKEKAEIEARSKMEMEQLMNEHTQTAEERRILQEQLKKESAKRLEMENQRLALFEKLKTMEEQVMKGGEIADKASKQEAALRKAEQDLVARREKELQLARQMAEQEETNLELEEKYSSLHDEVKAKTKKIEKLWTKFRQSKTEIKDLQSEFQAERNDMLETIRELTRQLKLKELIIDNFIPPNFAQMLDSAEVGGRAVWNAEAEEWSIPRLDITGNARRSQRMVSVNGLPRPESEYTRKCRRHDTNPRYRYDNVIDLELERPDRTTQDYEGPGMAKSQLSDILNMTMFDEIDPSGDVQYTTSTSPKNPYYQYDKKSASEDGSSKSKRSKAKSSRSRRRPDTSASHLLD